LLVLLQAFNIEALRIAVELHKDPTTSSLAPVAGCFVGEARVLACDHVWPNVLQSMVDPIRSSLDLFGAIKLHSDHFGEAKCIGSGKNEFETFLKDKFAVVSTVFRNNDDDKTTTGLPCRSLIEKHEQTVRNGLEYQWVLLLRGDIIYNSKLPPFSMWPKFDTHEKLVYVECCGSCSFPGPAEAGTLTGKCPFMCLSTINGKLGCAKDTWGLMTRKALPIYYKTEKDMFTETIEGSCYSPIAECTLGCQLHKHGVKVNLVHMGRQLLHATIPTEATNGTSQIALPDFRKDTCDKASFERETVPGHFTMQIS